MTSDVQKGFQHENNYGTWTNKWKLGQCNGDAIVRFIEKIHKNKIIKWQVMFKKVLSMKTIMAHEQISKNSVSAMGTPAIVRFIEKSNQNLKPNIITWKWHPKRFSVEKNKYDSALKLTIAQKPMRFVWRFFVVAQDLIWMSMGTNDWAFSIWINRIETENKYALGWEQIGLSMGTNRNDHGNK